MKRKVGLVIGYNGSKYHGLQFNKDVRTIESEIIKALLILNLIKKENAEDPKKIGMQRASRTDKGVHAAMSLIACKIESEVNHEIYENMKKLLIEKDIYLYKIIQLPGSFNPKKKCNQRFYEYVIPTFVFNDSLCDKKYLNEEDFIFINNLFQSYVGTYNFHNFTTTANTKGTTRYIKSITLSEPYKIEGIEYFNVNLLGNSFMLNQIRKMIGFVLTIFKYGKDKHLDLFKKVYLDQKWNIPKAPSEFLFLNKQCFDNYDSQAKYDKIMIDPFEHEKVKKEIIYPEIYKKEHLKVFKDWFEVFDKHFYEFKYLQE
ncbi:tRNA pseudouridine synthase 1 [Gurleya vavrai]